MVSVYPNPPPEQDFTRLYGEPMSVTGLNKKIRKPYTITKSRESWSEQEHDKFLEALQLEVFVLPSLIFDRDWKKIEAFIGSKTVIQIRSHAQKYFLKVQKSGTAEHVPPPRPKRKAAHPYPQKAPKYVASQPTGPLQPSNAPMESGYTWRPDSLSVPGNPVTWTFDATPTVSFLQVPRDDTGQASVSLTHNYSSSSNESTPRVWTSNDTNCQVKEKQCGVTRVMPDFAQVYSFIGSIFDPGQSDHLQRLRQMDPINFETALMLMKNLSVNLLSPEFEDHRRLLSSCNGGVQDNCVGSGIASV